MADPQPTDQPTPSWLTLAQAAIATGRPAEALRAMARRGRLPTMKGNDGRMLVQLTSELEVGRQPAAADLAAGQRVGQESAVAGQTADLAGRQPAAADPAAGQMAELETKVAGLEEIVAELRDEVLEARVAQARAEAERDGIRIAAEAEKSAIAVVVAELKAQLEHSRRSWWRRWLATLATCLALATSAHAAEALTGRARAIDGKSVLRKAVLGDRHELGCASGGGSALALGPGPADPRVDQVDRAAPAWLTDHRFDLDQGRHRTRHLLRRRHRVVSKPAPIGHDLAGIHVHVRQCRHPDALHDRRPRRANLDGLENEANLLGRNHDERPGPLGCVETIDGVGDLRTHLVRQLKAEHELGGVLDTDDLPLPLLPVRIKAADRCRHRGRPLWARCSRVSPVTRIGVTGDTHPPIASRGYGPLTYYI